MWNNIYEWLCKPEPFFDGGITMLMFIMFCLFVLGGVWVNVHLVRNMLYIRKTVKMAKEYQKGLTLGFDNVEFRERVEKRLSKFTKMRQRTFIELVLYWLAYFTFFVWIN